MDRASGQLIDNIQNRFNVLGGAGKDIWLTV